MINDKSSIPLTRYIFLTLSFLVSFIWYVAFCESRGDTLKVVFLDVGQGDAIYIEAPNGNSILIDGGANRTLLSELGWILPFYDRSINLILNTNPDADHYAGFIDLFSRYSVGLELEAGTVSKTETYSRYEQSLLGHKVDRILARKGMRLLLDTKYNIYLEILFPDQDVSKLKSNDGSVVAKLVYGKHKIMLQGDATGEVEQHLLNTQADVSASILKVGHHGSRTSTLFEYVKAVSPAEAVISAGLNNRYGHPHKQTIETLIKNGVKIRETRLEGAITYKLTNH